MVVENVKRATSNKLPYKMSPDPNIPPFLRYLKQDTTADPSGMTELSRKLYEEFKAKTKRIAQQYKEDYKYNKQDQRFDNNIKDDKFDEYIQERIDIKRFNDMQKDKKGQFIIEKIALKPIDKRSVEEKRFYTWHLKFKMPFFK
jgi:hypothetical protein